MNRPSIRDWGALLLDLVYPIRCCVCDRIDRGYFCTACQDSVAPIEPPYCERCQEPNEIDLCPGCRNNPPRFQCARAAGLFEGALKEALVALKYWRKERLVSHLAPLLEKAWRRQPEIQGAELLIPLPLHPDREKTRGFNQSRSLAEALAPRIGLPVLDDALTRISYQRPQVGLNRKERRENLRDAFHVYDKERIAGRRILLIDDVLTTGATCDEAAKALLSAGAGDVCVLTLAHEPFRD